MEPSSSDLKYFLEVTREGNMSKAARKLGISQPSLSLAIQRVERELGEKILIRDRSGARLTKSGEILLKHTHHLIDSWENVRMMTKKLSDELNGTIVLGCHPEVAKDSLPLFMSKLLRDFPGIEIVLRHDLSRNLTQDVINGIIDIGIIVNPNPYPDLIIKTLSYDEMGFWVHKTLLNKKGEIEGPSIFICQMELAQTQKLIRAFRKKGNKMGRIISSSDLEVICSLVGSGCGVGILPSEVALRNPRHNLVAIKESPILKDKVALVYRHENRNVKIVKTMAALITEGHERKYGKSN